MVTEQVSVTVNHQVSKNFAKCPPILCTSYLLHLTWLGRLNIFFTWLKVFQSVNYCIPIYTNTTNYACIRLIIPNLHDVHFIDVDNHTCNTTAPHNSEGNIHLQWNFVKFWLKQSHKALSKMLLMLYTSVVQWLTLSPHSPRALVWFWPVLARIPSGFSGFLLLS